jgi:hypothetical protein
MIHMIYFLSIQGLIKEQDNEIRRQQLRVIGILGAPDPRLLSGGINLEKSLVLASQTMGNAGVNRARGTSVFPSNNVLGAPEPAGHASLYAPSSNVIGKIGGTSGAGSTTGGGNATLGYASAAKPSSSDALQAASLDALLPVILDDYALHRLKGSDDFYHISALNALARVARDPILVAHHVIVARSLMLMMRCLGPKLFSHLDQIVPSFTAMARYAYDRGAIGQAEAFTFDLVRIVAMSREKMALHAVLVVNLVCQHWTPNMANIYLLRILAQELGSDFRPFLPKVLPFIRQTVTRDESPEFLATSRVLQFITDCPHLLYGWFDYIVEPVTVIVVNTRAPIKVRNEALDCLVDLTFHMPVKPVAGLLIERIEQILVDVDLRVNALRLLSRVLALLGSDFILLGFFQTVNEVRSLGGQVGGAKGLVTDAHTHSHTHTISPSLSKI